VPPSFFDLTLPNLKANDIDMYHGNFGEGPLEISRAEGAIGCLPPDIEDEVNTVQCLIFSRNRLHHFVRRLSYCLDIQITDDHCSVIM
jgi:hypothetical protein